MRRKVDVHQRLEEIARVGERRQAEIAGAQRERGCARPRPAHDHGRAERGHRGPRQRPRPRIGGIPVELGLGGLLREPQRGERQRRPRGRQRRTAGERGDRALGISRVLRASGVGGEIREREGHLAIAEQREHRRKRDVSRTGRGLGAKRGRLLVPELLDRAGGNSLRPLEHRAIPRQPVLGERRGEPERVIAQEPADTARLVEPMRHRAGRRARAILRREAEILLRHGERSEDAAIIAALASAKRRVSTAGRGSRQGPTAHPVAGAPHGPQAGRPRMVLGIGGDAREHAPVSIGQPMTRMREDAARGRRRSAAREAPRRPRARSRASSAWSSASFSVCAPHQSAPAA